MLAPWTAVIWLAVGFVVTFVMKGRPPASEVLGDLHSEDVGVFLILRSICAMTQPDRPLRLDAPREEALEHAVRLVTEAWRSFDRFRPEEPPLDDRVRRLLEAGLPSVRAGP